MEALRRISLSRKVPLFLAGFLLVALALTTSVEYVELRRLLERQARQQIEAASDLLANVLSQSLATGYPRFQAMGDSVGMRFVAEGGVPGPRTDSALARWVASSTQVRQVWLFRGGTCVRQAESAQGGPGPAGFSACTSPPPLRRVSQVAVSPIFAVGQEARYRVEAPLAAAGTDLVMVSEQTLGSSDAWSLISSLIASDARALIGNRDGSVWTDLGSIVEELPPAESSGDLVQFDRQGDRRLGLGKPIEGSPWVVLVHRSLGVILAPSRTFLVWITLSGIVVLALASLIGWAATGRMTRPLVAVTQGAEAMAGGDYSRRVEVDREDELGRLAEAFNGMAEKVQQGHKVLEQRVEQRTRGLQAALERVHEMQDELVRHERLAILGQLAGGVGHELRNPLGVMTNALYYLELVMPEPPEKVAEYLGILGTQVRTAETIVTDLLDFARVRDPKVAPVHVRDLVEDGLAQVTVPTGVDLDIDIPDSTGLAKVDRGQIRQVLSNLMTNAVQAMESRETRRLTVSAAPNGKGVVVKVRDTGIGIPPENLAKIFEPLVTTKARGIGLGLAVCRSLAEANGGGLTVESEVDVGTTFTLALPVSDGEAAE